VAGGLAGVSEILIMYPLDGMLLSCEGLARK